MNNDRIVYIMRGLPGSGKTTKAKELAGEQGAVVSADDFFMVDGEYKFDPSKIGQAHGACFRRAIEHLSFTGLPHPKVLVVDNTNISNIEIAPYVLLAQAHGWDHKIVTLHTTKVGIVAECVKRNTHGVPVERVTAMFEQLLTELPATPPWWTQEVIEPAVGA